VGVTDDDKVQSSRIVFPSRNSAARLSTDVSCFGDTNMPLHCNAKMSPRFLLLYSLNDFLFIPIFPVFCLTYNPPLSYIDPIRMQVLIHQSERTGKEGCVVISVKGVIACNLVLAALLFSFSEVMGADDFMVLRFSDRSTQRIKLERPADSIPTADKIARSEYPLRKMVTH
jgi:hypothetical protein